MSAAETEVSQQQRPYKINPNSLVNLRKFEPGQSGNPGGLPKGTPKVSNAYARLLALTPAELAEFKPSNVAEELALARIKAAKGEDKPYNTAEITDRTEGKARQAVDINSTTININVQLFIDASADLATRHNVPLELAQARMLALAEPAQRAAIEAALVAMVTE